MTATRPWVRRALVAGEVALAVVLVAGAGLMVRTVFNLMNVDGGFDRSRLVTFGIALPAATYPTLDQRMQVYSGVIDRISGMPGIEAVAAVTGLPPQRERNLFGTDIENYTSPPERAELVEYYQTVTSGYFEPCGYRSCKAARSRRPTGLGAPVAVVNEAFVRTFWKGIDPIGQHVRPRFGDRTPSVTVIGVAKDVKQAGVDKPTGTEVYFLLDQLPRIFPTVQGARLGSLGDASLHIMLRTALPASTLQASITSAVHEADPSLPIIRLRNMEEVFRDSVRRPRMLMQLFTGVRSVRAPVGGDRYLRRAFVRGDSAAA
jgi:hypothetical protein